MPRPKILDELYNHVESSNNPHAEMGWINTAEDGEQIEETLPVDADTLGGHPANYFASKSDVNLAISNYVATVLGKSY